MKKKMQKKNHVKKFFFWSIGSVLFTGFLVGVYMQYTGRLPKLTVGDAQSRFYEEAYALANTPYVKQPTASTITGLPCSAFDARPLAIMYSGDVETRPYFSGIADAGFVVEMAQRYPSGATRIMGVFDCDKPSFVGPMRSGRPEFLNIAASFDAIFVPWGGDGITRTLLESGVHNHIDCGGEVGPLGLSDACFERSVEEIPLAPEDRTYSDAARLFDRAQTLGYNLENTFAGYNHQADAAIGTRERGGDLLLDYLEGFRVRYSYNPELNRYERYFEGAEEYDFASGERIAPRNVIVLKTKKIGFAVEDDYPGRDLRDPWEGKTLEQAQNESGLYPNFALGDAWFDTVREGWAHFYIDGREIIGSWRRDRKDPRAPFTFYNGSGEEIRFVPGQIWLHVMDETRNFSWEPRG